jgi:gamma-glutamylcyclotransferase (GGCT)/AIG2-like uncharacterized protein YtfP
MPVDSSEFVFVCGDLRRGGSLEFLLESADFFAEGLVRGKLIAVDGCPGLVPRTWGGFVKGEIYRLTYVQREQLGDREVRATGQEQAKIDFHQVLLEVIPHHQGREPVQAWGWKWTGPEEGYPVVESGDWQDREMSSPWCTWIAFVCMLFLPVGYVAATILARSVGGTKGIWLGSGCAALAFLSPIAGVIAALLGNWRRESASTMRGILLPLLTIAAIPALIALVILLRELF